MTIPEDLRYTAEHEWVRPVEEGRVRIGITSYATCHVESTQSRTKRRTGPWSRAGRNLSSPERSPARILRLDSLRFSRSSFCAAFLSIPARARSRAAASASLRVGVGRPLPPIVAVVVDAVGSAGFSVRRNNGGLIMFGN